MEKIPGEKRGKFKMRFQQNWMQKGDTFYAGDDNITYQIVDVPRKFWYWRVAKFFHLKYKERSYIVKRIKNG